jgi:uncharacterized protein (DUF4415 family)
MVNHLPLIDEDGEVNDLSEVDHTLFKPATEVLPSSLQKKLGMGNLPSLSAKQRVVLNLSCEVIERFKAMGDGWQERIDTVLVNWLQTHSL